MTNELSRTVNKKKNLLTNPSGDGFRAAILQQVWWCHSVQNIILGVFMSEHGGRSDGGLGSGEKAVPPSVSATAFPRWQSDILTFVLWHILTLLACAYVYVPDR